MSSPRAYTVYARNLGRHVVQAYDKRHAVAVVVARLRLDESSTACVTTWAVSERGRDNFPADPEARSSAEIGSLEAAPPHERSAAAADGEKRNRGVA